MGSQNNFRYVALADEIQENIMDGQFRPGDKLPSLRRLHNRLGLSITTIHQAYIELEKRGRVEAKEKSGFYVKPLSTCTSRRPQPQKAAIPPQKIRINELAETILSDLQRSDMLHLGAAVASKELMPLKQLSRIMKSAAAQEIENAISTYDNPAGLLDLRAALARQMLGLACPIGPDDIVTTNGCLEAVSLCLKAVASPGDTILVESPAFHCFLQLLEDLGLYVLEMPGCPETGIDPDDFEKIITANKITACLVNTNFQNPMGSVMPRTRKQRLLTIALNNKIPIIEDDIYGDIYYDSNRPSTFKSLDTKGMVLYCSSVSKTLAPGLRCGWAIPGRFRDNVLRLKLNQQLASPNLGHQAVADFLASGAYDRHARRLRNQIKNQASAMTIAVARHFPEDIRVSFPRGGMVLWIELNPGIDTMEIYHAARQHHLSILPGRICSSTDRYRHCLRLNCGLKWNRELENGVALLGRLVKQAYQRKNII